MEHLLDHETNNDLMGELGALLNRYSRENCSNTPDYILAEYLVGCLAVFERATIRRDGWYGLDLEPARVVYPKEI